MSSFAEEEKDIIEAMAQAMCEAMGGEPDAPYYEGTPPADIMINPKNYPTRLQHWRFDALRQYAAYKAMLEFLSQNTPAPWNDYRGQSQTGDIIVGMMDRLHGRTKP